MRAYLTLEEFLCRVSGAAVFSADLELLHLVSNNSYNVYAYGF